LAVETLRGNTYPVVISRLAAPSARGGARWVRQVAPLLHLCQQLGGHQRREATEDDLAAPADRRLDPPPAGLVQAWLLFQGSPQPALMGAAIDGVVASALPCAGGDDAAQ
jgi:hypothetical protein